MRDDEFEWDEEKAAQNLRAHGVSFETAREVFRNPFAIDRPDTRENYGEDRYGMVGMTQSGLVYVAYTVRAGRARIISARNAESVERREYHEESK